MKRVTQLSWLAVAVLLVAASCGPATVQNNTEPVAAAADAGVAPIRVQAQPSSSSSALSVFEGALENVYQQVSPSVVNIQVTIESSGLPSGLSPFGGLPQFQQPPTQSALGSGFVWDKQGHIVTNNHVVEGASRITVTFADGTSVDAKLVGADPDSDLAVIQVDVAADHLKPVTTGDSTQVQVGQLAIAIGNPFGLQGTMTLGIISALGRLLPVDNSSGPAYSIPDIIQTDAPINPGNSGGVLVDDQGHVIGVTSAIESPVQANAGVGFAIPSAIVNQVVPALIQDGHYDHPWLGIGGVTLTPDMAQAMGLPADQRGALVITVTPDSPAAKAGLRGSDNEATIDGETVPVGGDVIVAIDQQAVKGMDDLIGYLGRSAQVGQTVTLTVLRDGKEQQIDVTLAARPSETPALQTPQEASTGAVLGIQGMTLTPAIAEADGLDSSQQGVLVESVTQGSAADAAGLRGSYKEVTVDGQQILVGGDIITAFDGQTVTGIQNLISLLGQASPGQQATLTILRDGRTVRIEVTLGAGD
jgi:serine protease Do